MKKLGIFVMSLMTVSVLASCENAKVEHFVTFDTKGGSHIETQRVKDGEKAVKPEDPERGVDHFKGWSTEENSPYTFDEIVTSDITLFADWEKAPDSYHFKFTGNNCFLRSVSTYETDIVAGASEQFEITLEDGYSLPTNDEEHFKIIVGGNVTYDASKGIITISKMTSDVEIEATAIKKDSYKFSFSGTGCTMNGSPTYEENNIEAGADRQYTILPDAGHVLPEEITIPEPIKSFVSYSKGIITIENMSGDVTLENVIAPEEEIEYSINFSGTNCKAKGGSVTEFTQSFQTTRSSKDTSNLVLTLALDSDKYLLPDSVEVFFNNNPGSYPDDYEYNKEEGTITIKKMANTLIRVEAGKALHTITLDACDGTFYNGEQTFAFNIADGNYVSRSIKTINTPILKDNTFAYYTYMNDTPVNYEDQVTGDITLKAHYFDITEPKDENLDTIDWQELKNVSVTNKNPSTCYKIGAVKHLKLKNLHGPAGTRDKEFDYASRIIGFNHDHDCRGNLIGITFEFYTTLIWHNGAEWKQLWMPLNRKEEGKPPSNADYRVSTLNNYLNDETPGTDSVINMFPSDLAKMIVPTDIKVGVYKNNKYEATSFEKDKCPKLFVLAHDEIYIDPSQYVTSGEGTLYDFYRITPGPGSRYKYDRGDQMPYWLRSPNISDSTKGTYVDDNVGAIFLFGLDVTDTFPAIAPVFCL